MQAVIFGQDSRVPSRERGLTPPQTKERRDGAGRGPLLQLVVLSIARYRRHTQLYFYFVFFSEQERGPLEVVPAFSYHPRTGWFEFRLLHVLGYHSSKLNMT